jgi:hypothetical protein
MIVDYDNHQAIPSPVDDRTIEALCGKPGCRVFTTMLHSGSVDACSGYLTLLHLDWLTWKKRVG